MIKRTTSIALWRMYKYVLETFFISMTVTGVRCFSNVQMCIGAFLYFYDSD